ncbi:hypothetical protein BDQ12DRAFT_671970 [Crucibulum laeve]|uniref:Uncharacterized protein n=1 Tax=Crucibulum laeve TaxID=68775 RepID=A0A5C3LF85_9AGAR|nr:hypothetical protein BDQ12DRAFT_671970 [Crucibulum laeve]
MVVEGVGLEVWLLAQQASVSPARVTIHSYYVASKENPADNPSQGIFQSSTLLLPPIPIPNYLKDYIVNFNAPHQPVELHLAKENRLPISHPKPNCNKLKNGSLKCKAGSELLEKHMDLSRPEINRTNCQPAPYNTVLCPLPSPAQPHMLCSDWLELWIPLTAREVKDINDNPRITQTVAEAYEESTRSAYGSSLLVYHIFCNKMDIPEDQCAPASPVVIAAFITAISEIETLLQAVDKATPATSKHKKQQPYTIAFITAIQSKLDLNLPLHTAVYACLTTTFWAAARVGKFTVPRLDAFNPQHHFIGTLATAAQVVGLNPLQGHGIRIGATLEYLLQGVPFEVMKAKGCWASDTFYGYLTKHAQILAPYMQADPALHEAFVWVTMWAPHH